ncbi:TetR/AcrR family transcriptional regulator [Membranihabitans maritimus]|uniref:TetR/AcrR family transcriptional regulator n=1 Tax=Membranihabitans maritimus TaxID=2904244 RepID=UPI001F38C630
MKNIHKKTAEDLKIQRKQEIGSVALELFANHGFHNTSVSEIASKAGISKGLMYNYFHSKDELLEYIIQDSFERSKEIFNFRDWENMSASEQLSSTFENTLIELKKNPHYYRLLMLLTLQGDVKLKIIKDVLDMKEKFFPVFQEMLEKLGVNPHESEKTYFLLGAAMDGLVLHYLYMDEDYKLDEMFEFFRKKLLIPIAEGKF